MSNDRRATDVKRRHSDIGFEEEDSDEPSQ